VRVTIQDILVPGAILSLHNAPLESFGSVPFDVLVKETKLQGHPVSATAATPSGPQVPSIQPPGPTPIDKDLLDFFSQHVSPDANWTDDIDDPSDTFEDFDEEKIKWID